MDLDSKQSETSRDAASAAGWRYLFEYIVFGAIADVASLFIISAAPHLNGWVAYGAGAVLAMVLYWIYSGKPWRPRK